MKVKRYVAKDMRQALKQVRDELGPEAVILSNRRVKRGVEILASLEYDESEPNQYQQTDATTPEINQEEPVYANPRFATASGQTAPSAIDSAFENFLNQYKQPVAPAEASADEELMDAMRSEIENLRLLLKDQMSYISDEHRALKHPAEAAIRKRLTECGFSNGLALKVARKTGNLGTVEESWEAALRLIKKHLRVMDHDMVSSGGTFALIGPTGAGKTTTIAKLAIRYALRYGIENLALVSTDQHRIAAYEQLRTLARIIDVPVRLVDEQNSLDAVLRSLRHKQLVLIDMAGFPPGEELREQQLEQLVQAKADIKKLLVLPCTSQRSALLSAITTARSCKIDGCIVSKTDEAASLGEVLSLVVEKQLPLAYITNGQSIPDDIELAQAEFLINKACSKYLNVPDVAQTAVTNTAKDIQLEQALTSVQPFASARV